MTVVEAYVRRKKITPPEDSSQFNMVVSSLIHEGIAPNTSGSVSLTKLRMIFEVSRSESTVLQDSPFHSEKKRWGVALKKPNSKVLVHWKGAAGIVLASCATYLDSNGSQQSIENEYFYLAVYVL